MIDGILFDVHRTLVDDSGFPRERIWRLIAGSGVEIDLDAYYKQYHQLSAQMFDWRRIDPFITIREIHRRRLLRYYELYDVKRDVEADLEYLWREMGKSKIYPEVPEVLNHLKGNYRIGLLSNADDDDPLIEILLNAGFTFDAVVTSQACQIYKPDTRIFDYALKALELDRQQVLMVGDSLVSDVAGAVAAGIDAVWINRSNQSLQKEFPKPTHQISNMNQLLVILNHRRYT
ncbi:HAD-IA family hydrolase [candidate division KSB1 bacterium]|nr:HAD-IA family hydrolase [candidate division KSB1 bacterium]